MAALSGSSSKLEECDICSAVSLPEFYDLIYEMMNLSVWTDNLVVKESQRKKNVNFKFCGECNGCGKRDHMKKLCWKKTNANVVSKSVFMADDA